MAIALNPKNSYQLVSEHESQEDKLIIHVKLTDSCLRALEEFTSKVKSPNKQAKIRFSGQNGTISIPTSRVDNDQRQFSISCSRLESSLGQESLDCVQQTATASNLLSLGAITHKMNIKATDDSYQTTRNKMNKAEEERKGVRTQVIKITASKGRRKVATHRQQNQLLSQVKKKMLSNTSVPRVTPVANGQQKSYRDKIIHLLAIRPFKKPELISRLNKDGITQKDKGQSLINILKQVATMQDNQFRLNKHLWSEIQVDWPYYSDAEKQSVKKQIDGTANHIQSSSPPKITTISSNTEIQPLKRPSSNENLITPVAKKPRVSHATYAHENTKPNENSKTVIKPATSTSGSPDTTADKIKDNDPNSPESPGLSNGLLPMASSTSETNEYVLKYIPISSYDQRCAYKKDFQAEYEEYRKLKDSIDSVTRKFAELDRSWRRYPPGSKEAKEIQEKVFRLYDMHQKDPEWQLQKKRCQELHAKLSHVKKLIVEYDSLHCHGGSYNLVTP